MYHYRRAKTMNKRQEQQIVDYYSTTDRYIRSDRYSVSHIGSSFVSHRQPSVLYGL